MDEFFEVFTALQLETIQKPIGILNINGYYDTLIQMIGRMVNDQFFRKEHFQDLIISSDPEEFHKLIINHQPARVESWVNELRKKNTF
jgi:predicted Rossmann-fold nucleotide-binding protein